LPKHIAIFTNSSKRKLPAKLKVILLIVFIEKKHRYFDNFLEISKKLNKTSPEQIISGKNMVPKHSVPI